MDACKIRIEPKRYELVRLQDDPPERNHHAIVFTNVPDAEKLIPKSKLPSLLTLTLTGHGCVKNWDLVDYSKVKTGKVLHVNLNAAAQPENSGNTFFLLVPRSLWIWFVPEWIMPKGTKMRLFYLEAHDPFKPVAVLAKKVRG